MAALRRGGPGGVGRSRHAVSVRPSGPLKAAGLDEAALHRLLRHQDLIISRQQALACGMTPDQLRHRIRPGGPWQRLLPGVYLTVTGTPTRRQHEVGALQCGGADSVLTGTAALAHHGVRVREGRPIIVLVPAGKIRQNQGLVRIWPTTRMPEFVFTDGAVRFADAARAVADAARELGSFREVRAVTADAVQRGRCRIDQLAEELAHAPVRQSAWLRRTLAEVADGVRSAAEGDLRSLIRAAGLPAPIFNARLYIGPDLLAVVDAWWPDAGVAVEVDSREWHLSPEDSQRTARRSRGMSAKGIIMLHVTPHQIRTEAEKIVADIRGALESGRARPPLAIRTLPAAG
jgi:very-short-patch-repair endonuclease